MTRSFRLLTLPIAIGWWSVASVGVSTQAVNVLFNDETLQEVRLTISQRDWQTLRDHVELDNYFAADFRYNGQVVRNVGVRSRGNTTRNPVKPGLRIDFNRYLADQEFLGLKALVLDNAYSDATLIRESLAMKMFARLGLAAPREAHARVYVNGEYLGAYTLVESIDRAFVARVFGEREAHIERGGYLFEYNWAGPYGFEYLGPRLEAYGQLFSPETRETDSMIKLYGPQREMIREINESPDDRLVSNVGRYLDLPHFMKYLAIEDFLAETDGLVSVWGLHNFFYYRFADGRPAQLIPWDKDSTFSAADHPVDYRLDTNVLTRRAMAIPELSQIYVDTLLACADLAEEGMESDSPGWLERETGRQASQIEASVADDPGFPFTFEQFHSDVAALQSFARTRPQFIRCRVSQTCDAAGAGPDARAARPR